MSEQLGSFEQAPGERLDYPVDAARFLSGGDTIASVTATSDSTSVTIDDVQWGDTSVIIWVTGGADGDSAEITVTITTTLGRVAKACFRLKIREC